MGLRGRFLLLLAVTLASIVLPRIEASATDCTNTKEQGYWIRSTDFPAFGTQNTIPVKDRTLAFDCQAEPPGGAENHHTANITDSTFSNQAEAGYVEEWGPSSSHVCRFFYETQIGSVITGNFDDGPQVSCTLGSTGFRVVNVDTTDNWKFYFNTGSGYTQFGPSGGQNASFHRGYPRGESARRGDPGTSAADDQSSLRWKTNRSCTSNCWTRAWSTNEYDPNTSGCIPGWVYDYISADEFKIVSGTHTC
jgi:hypothetical protein